MKKNHYPEERYNTRWINGELNQGPVEDHMECAGGGGGNGAGRDGLLMTAMPFGLFYWIN